MQGSRWELRGRHKIMRSRAPISIPLLMIYILHYLNKDPKLWEIYGTFLMMATVGLRSSTVPPLCLSLRGAKHVILSEFLKVPLKP